MKSITDGHSKRRSAFIITASFVVIAAVALSAAFIITMTSPGEASKKLSKEELGSKAIENSREYLPSASSAEVFETQGIETGKSASFYIKDSGNVTLGVVCVDPNTGLVTMLYRCMNGGSSSSEDVKISLDEAKKIAEGFLSSKDVLENCVCEQAVLNRVGVDGPPDQLQGVFQYEFSYRPQIDGIPVYEAGGSSVWISPEDGSIFYFSICPSLMSGSEAIPKALLNKEEAEAAAIKECYSTSEADAAGLDIISCEYRVYSEQDAWSPVELCYIRNEDGSMRIVWRVTTIRELESNSGGVYDKIQDLQRIYEVDAITGETVLMGII